MTTDMEVCKEERKASIKLLRMKINMMPIILVMNTGCFGYCLNGEGFGGTP